MQRTAASATTLGLAGLVAGPAAGWLFASLRAPDGGLHATALTSTSPVWGLLVGLGVVLLASASGLLAAFLVGPGRGLFAMGLVLLWPAARSAEVEQLFRAVEPATALRRLAVEGLVLGLATAAGAWLVVRVGERNLERTWRLDRRGAIDLAVGSLTAAVAMAFVAWIVAVEGLKGQTIAAGVLAGVAAGLMGRFTGGAALRWLIPLAATLAAVWAPLWALRLHGAAALQQAAYAGVLFPPARLAPLDWLCGALAGGAAGWSWASAALLREERSAAAASPGA